MSFKTFIMTETFNNNPIPVIAYPKTIHHHYEPLWSYIYKVHLLCFVIGIVCGLLLQKFLLYNLF